MKIERLGVYASLGGISLTALYTLVAVFKNNWSLEGYTAIASLAIIAILLAFLALVEISRYSKLLDERAQDSTTIGARDQTIEDLTRSIEELEGKNFRLERYAASINKNVHNVSREIKHKINSLLVLVIRKYNEETITRNDISQFDKNFNMSMLSLLSHIRDVFDETTNSECSVCIKILLSTKDSEITRVKTFMRDPRSYPKRLFIDNKYPEYSISENTAFRNIMAPHNDDLFFINNDLSSYEYYENKNANRHKYYNASIVAPIWIHVDSDAYRPIAFLCVDNMNGGFREDRDIVLLQAFASLLFPLFSMFDEVGDLIDDKLGDANSVSNS